ncbi:MAG: type I methionyl aminopeptidase [Bacteroidaceae bacterium]|nr:type I methionyl aminopeptidase [Bacteroidaceae bacterium]MBP5731224.1 type I methionyl aminopeptidase [Bacteroidaceae bacterium]
MPRKIKNNWIVPKGQPLTEVDEIVLDWQARGYLVPKRELIKTPEQIEGIRRSGKITNGALDLVAREIKAGMTTEDINRLVHEYTLDHGGTPAPLNYEGFPKSVCTSINDVVCHGIPSEEEMLLPGDIVNVDVTTIYKGYYADASRMYIIEDTYPEWKRLVKVAKECRDLGAAATKPYSFVGDMAKVITKHAHQNGCTVVRELCGHGVGLDFHEAPDVDHYGVRGKSGMLLVPGMVFTIEPMINLGGREVFQDEDDGWTICTEDGQPSAQWEHTYLLTPHGLEVLV